MIDAEDKKKKVDEILAALVYNDQIDQDERKRVNKLYKSFHEELQKLGIARSEPIKNFVEEQRNKLEDLNLVLCEKENLDEVERKALFRVKNYLQESISFWAGSEARAQSLANEIDTEHKLKTS